MSCSLDLRERALAAIAGGMSVTQATVVFGVSRATLYRWLERQAQDDLAPRCSPGGPRKIPPEQETQLEAQLRQHPDVTLDEHRRLWHQEQGQLVSHSTLKRAMARLQWTRKKRV
jgi:transposase